MKVRKGSTRWVILIGRYAIKLPSFYSWKMFLNGLLANLTERSFAPLDKDRLCPILFAAPGGFLVVMPRANELSDAEWAGLDLFKFTRHADYCLPVEMKRDSFGTLGGRIVAIDYGS